MNKIINRTINSKIIPSNYVNTETGEVLTSEISKGISITLKENTNQFIINSNNYITFTKEAIEYLSREVSNNELFKITTMANMLRTDCAIVCQENNHPHTPDTLSLSFDMCINKWYEFVRKMVKKNILSYCVCAPSGYVQKIYMLNPYIARKRTTFNCELSSFFRDVTKDGELKD
jgi:hypothetical protein